MNNLERFLHNEDGQDVVEYGLLAALISIAALLTIKAIGPLVNGLYEKVKGALA